MTGYLYIGGRGPDPAFLRRFAGRPGTVCAADSGLDACAAAGVRPDAIVGDMDSLSDRSLLEAYPGAVVEEYPRDKDDTDAEIGLSWLRSAGCRRVVMIGGGEGRLDHTLALRALYDRPDPPDLWLTALEEVSPVEGLVELRGPVGAALSLFPAGEGPWAARSRGLRWNLDGVSWKRGTVGISNRLAEETAEIFAFAGRLIMVRPLGDGATEAG